MRGCWPNTPPWRAREWLPLLEAAVARGQALAWHAAYLADRVLIQAGAAQRYGTQSLVTDDAYDAPGARLWPIRDPRTVNQLRAAAGLPALPTPDLERAWTWRELHILYQTGDQ